MTFSYDYVSTNSMTNEITIPSHIYGSAGSVAQWTQAGLCWVDLLQASGSAGLEFRLQGSTRVCSTCFNSETRIKGLKRPWEGPAHFHALWAIMSVRISLATANRTAKGVALRERGRTGNHNTIYHKLLDQGLTQKTKVVVLGHSSSNTRSSERPPFSMVDE